jgi:putative transposase
MRILASITRRLDRLIPLMTPLLELFQQLILFEAQADQFLIQASSSFMDWYSRYVLSWRLSNTLEGSFCLAALEEALELGKPRIFNSDQGVQFTGLEFTGRLEAEGIAVSHDGRGRALDNVFVERLWRSVKYEDVYIKDYGSVVELETGLTEYFQLYNDHRPHQNLNYQTPASVHFQQVSMKIM